MFHERPWTYPYDGSVWEVSLLRRRPSTPLGECRPPGRMISRGAQGRHQETNIGVPFTEREDVGPLFPVPLRSRRTLPKQPNRDPPRREVGRTSEEKDETGGAGVGGVTLLTVPDPSSYATSCVPL